MCCRISSPSWGQSSQGDQYGDRPSYILPWFKGCDRLPLEWQPKVLCAHVQPCPENPKFDLPQPVELYWHYPKSCLPLYLSPDCFQSDGFRLAKGTTFSPEPGHSTPGTEEIPLDAHDPEVCRRSWHVPRLPRNATAGTERFTRFSSLTSLQHAITHVIVVARKFRRRKEQQKLHLPTTESRHEGDHTSGARRGLWGDAKVGAPCSH